MVISMVKQEQIRVVISVGKKEQFMVVISEV